jgi:cation-transporting ATPase E
METSKKPPWVKISLLIMLGVGVLSAVAWSINRYLYKKRMHKEAPEKIFQGALRGLSHAEAQRRKSDNRVKARLAAEKKLQKDQLKRRIFSIFNVTMLVLAVTQIFLNDIWGALGTLGALILNIAISVFHQIRSAKQVGKMLSITRPKATVLREGILSNIDLDDVVIGDFLVVGKGDEIFADGTILESSKLQIDMSPLDPTRTIEHKQDGDWLTSGSYCEAGWAIYRVEHIADEVDEDQISVAAIPISEIRTPLQKGIRVMLLILLAIAGLFYGILIIELLRL